MNGKSFLGSWCPRDAKKSESKEERLFVKNGSWLLEEQIKSCDRKHTPIRIFSAKELERATNNYDPQKLFHEEGPYNLYKGTYEQDREISVKKFKEGSMEIKQIVNEIVIASQMSYHNNVVKFFGCCLETRFPMLVYEFVGISTLSDHICKNKEENLPAKEMLPWEKKLMITIDIANVLTYLHTSGSKPIIHRGIKSYNIFVDRHYVAKLPGFTFSLTIPLGETHVVAPVAGTVGYIDPDCISGRFTEKSDVYSFGAVLLEVLTGNYAVDIEGEVSNMMDSDRSGYDDSTSMGHPDLPKHWFTEQYLKSNILKEGNIEQSMACVEIALRCLRENPEERPTMMEVAQELRRISKILPL